MFEPDVLIVSSKFDLTCDFVVSQLSTLGVSYARIDIEGLNESVVELDPVEKLLTVRRGRQVVRANNDSLRSVYFRRPVYVREYGTVRDPEDWFTRTHWNTFLCSLMLWDKPAWFNNPTATYFAEHKAVQLALAAELGFAVPPTRITNQPRPQEVTNARAAIAKGLDTVMLRFGTRELFGFTHLLDSSDFDSPAWRSAPVILQHNVANKTDLRVTVIDDVVFAARITRHSHGIAGDWRVHKADVDFRSVDLAPDVEELCVKLVRALGLRFGTIDLAEANEEVMFLEVNPTGEWAWLVEEAGLPIDKCMAQKLGGLVDHDFTGD